MKPSIAFLSTLCFLFLFSHLRAQSWEGQAVGMIPLNYGVFATSVVNDSVVWAVAFDRTFSPPSSHITYVLKTTNGGQSWNSYEVTSANGRVSYDIHAFGPDTAYITTTNMIIGPNNGIFRTTDGGNSWTNIYNDLSGGILIRFFNRQEGVSISPQFISTTSDGGDTWQAVPTDSIPTFGANEILLIYSGNASCRVMGSTAWFVTNEGRVFRSKNKGHSWEVSDAGLGSILLASIVFTDSLNGLVSTNTNPTLFARTTDGGETWTPQATSSNVNLREMVFLPQTDSTLIGFLNGNNNAKARISYDFGRSWSQFGNTGRYGAAEFLDETTGWMGRGEVTDFTQPVMYKFRTCNNSTNTQFIDACNSYTWPVNGQTYDQTGVYSETLMSSEGCDSTVNLILNVVPLVLEIEAVGGTLTAGVDNASYQWVTCEADGSQPPIAGETNQSFTPTVSGNYAVEVTTDDCVGTTECTLVCFPSTESIQQSGDTLSVLSAEATYQWLDCANGNAPVAGATQATFVPSGSGTYAVTITSAIGCVDTLPCVSLVLTSKEELLPQLVEVFPNPTSDQLQLIGQSQHLQRYELYHVNGQLIQQGPLSTTQLDLSKLAKGLYLLKTFGKDHQLTATHKVVKQ